MSKRDAVTARHLDLLTTHGFKWYKDGSTERVESDDIERIEASEGGFTVYYTDNCAIVSTTAKVHRIDVPDDLENTWIYVYFDVLDDERRTT